MLCSLGWGIRSSPQRPPLASLGPSQYAHTFHGKMETSPEQNSDLRTTGAASCYPLSRSYIFYAFSSCNDILLDRWMSSRRQTGRMLHFFKLKSILISLSLWRCRLLLRTKLRCSFHRAPAFDRLGLMHSPNHARAVKLKQKQ